MEECLKNDVSEIRFSFTFFSKIDKLYFMRFFFVGYISKKMASVSIRVNIVPCRVQELSAKECLFMI